MPVRSNAHESSLPPPHGPHGPQDARSDRARAATPWPHVMVAALLTIAMGYATGVAEMQVTLLAAGVALLALSRVMRAYARRWTPAASRADGRRHSEAVRLTAREESE